MYNDFDQWLCAYAWLLCVGKSPNRWLRYLFALTPFVASQVTFYFAAVTSFAHVRLSLVGTEIFFMEEVLCKLSFLRLCPGDRILWIWGWRERNSVFAMCRGGGRGVSNI